MCINGNRSASKSSRIIYPLGLTALRLLLGPVAVSLALCRPDAPRWCFAVILLGGFLSDYFDGVLARKLGVAYPWLRRLDSVTDVIFYLLLFSVACILEWDTLRQGLIPILLLLGGEAGCILLSFVRFRSFPAAHCYSAKLYGVFLFIVFLGVLCFRWGSWSLWLLALVGLAADFEILLVLCLAREAPVDVLWVLTWCKRRNLTTGRERLPRNRHWVDGRVHLT